MTNLGLIRNEFLGFLLKDLDAGNTPERAKHKRSKRTPNIVRTLSFREMGVKDQRASDDHFYHALIKSKRRSFEQRNYDINPKGRFCFDDFWIFHYRSKKLVNVKTDEEFPLEEMMLPFEKVASCIFVQPCFPVPAPDRPPHYLVFLTDIHIYVYDIVKRSIIAVFVFPAEYKFSKIFWNKDNDELCATGFSRNIGNSVSYEKRPCLAVFTLLPFRCKYAFVMNPQIFPKITEAMIIDDALMCFCQSPYRFIAYNMRKLYQNTCTQLEMAQSDGRTTIVWNLHITEEPPRILEVKGHYNNIFFGLDTIIQLDPQAQGEKYRLRNFRDIRSQPTLLDGVTMPRESDPTAFTLDEPQLSGYTDSTPRMLRINGNCVECYEASRVVGSEKTEVRVGWRTALVPRRPMAESAVQTTRFGRVVKSVMALAEDDYTVKLMDLAQHNDYVVAIIAYDVNTFNYPILTVNPQNPCWVSVVFFLNESNGEIVRAEPLKMDFSNLGLNDFRQTATLLDECLLITTTDSSKTSLQILEMVEAEAEEWERNEVEVEELQRKFTPSTMSRKQRRLARRAELQQRYSPPV